MVQHGCLLSAVLWWHIRYRISKKAAAFLLEQDIKLQETNMLSLTLSSNGTLSQFDEQRSAARRVDMGTTQSVELKSFKDEPRKDDAELGLRQPSSDTTSQVEAPTISQDSSTAAVLPEVTELEQNLVELEQIGQLEALQLSVRRGMAVGSTGAEACLAGVQAGVVQVARLQG